MLYEFEACPYCRLVREALTELDLDAIIRPCPRGGRRFRPIAQEIAGRSQFPLLVDPNTGVSLLDSREIISYLYETYCENRQPKTLIGQTADTVRSQLGSLPRVTRGLNAGAQGHAEPTENLILYSFEASPYSRLVREKLCELELPYLLKNTGKDKWEDMGTPAVRDTLFPGQPVTGRNRIALHQRTARVQVPYLIDPNTETEMFESRDICRYLDAQYGR